ncbi:HNH endonuclease signature motif containing protein [Nocardioides solisilvae]|uniref:HNH endonuclease signature motif containing protein n=1 Tax=Nocardioides solisilvae TaxID=1542435 RepID=UPI000D7508D6|nr:HNH endonuclease signature motif containing protein [Nocardioides solisilvae]
MDTPSLTTGSHPVLTCAAAFDAMLDEVGQLDPVFMEVAAKREALQALDRVATRVAALKQRVLATAQDVADAEGDRDVAAFLTRTTRSDRATVRREQRLAHACDARWHGLGAALSEGAVNLDQAHVIARGLDDLARTLHDLVGDRSITPAMTPERVTGLLAAGEAHLLEKASEFDPRALARIAAKILEVLVPHVADETEARRLAREDRHARRVTSLTRHRLGDGTTVIKARVPDATASRLMTNLEAFTNPRKQQELADEAAGGPAAGPTEGRFRAADATGEPLPYDLRLGRAFCSLLESLDPGSLPLHGGLATTLVITADVRTLVHGLGHGTLHTGEAVSAGELRRLACTAGLVPAVLGTGSHVLDLGLTARLFSPAQRRALALRDKHCRARGCDIPATWCEAHHLRPWSDLGPTDLANGILLCSRHHHLAHDERYVHERLPDGDLVFTRRRR